MKKLLMALSFIFLLITGCEKDYITVIDPSTSQSNVDFINLQDSMDYETGDSILITQIKVTPISSVNDISASLNDPFGDLLWSGKLYDNGNIQNYDTTAGDGVYGGGFIISNSNPSGNYLLDYFINGKQAAVQSFYFDNGKQKYPPELSNLIIKDSVAFNETFDFSVTAKDSNGAQDIALVYYELFRPDGSQVVNSQGISKFPMYDNGDPAIGDLAAGDGIYSFRLTFPPGVPPGTWRFEFSAVDRSNRLSNKIIHYIEVH